MQKARTKYEPEYRKKLAKQGKTTRQIEAAVTALYESENAAGASLPIVIGKGNEWTEKQEAARRTAVSLSVERERGEKEAAIADGGLRIDKARAALATVRDQIEKADIVAGIVEEKKKLAELIEDEQKHRLTLKQLELKELEARQKIEGLGADESTKAAEIEQMRAELEAAEAEAAELAGADVRGWYVGDLLWNMEQMDGVCLRDPIEPDYQDNDRIAIFRAEDGRLDGGPGIDSFAHPGGTLYQVYYDFAYLDMKLNEIELETEDRSFLYDRMGEVLKWARLDETKGEVGRLKKETQGAV